MPDFLNTIVTNLKDFYDQYAVVIATFIPLGIIGIWRWSVFLFKRFVARNYRITPNNDFRDTISVVVPVYNEDPRILRLAMNSWLENKPDEIVLVIDAQDTQSIGIIEEYKRKVAAAKSQTKIKLIITTVPGKRPALLRGYRESTSDIVALVDSDTIWTRNLLPKIFAPFIDPTVGGVAPRQYVWEPETVVQRIYAIQLDGRYEEELPFLTAKGDTITCISGRTAIYRRSALEPVMDGLVTETFAGAPCVSGDDKYLTRVVQANGWKVRYQKNAIVYTSAARDWKTYLRQRTRWTRNSWRSDLKEVFDRRRWLWKHKSLAFHTLDRFVQPFALILSPIFFAASVYYGFYVSAAILMLWWFVSRSIKNYRHLREKPSDLGIIWPYTLTSFVIAGIKIYAWCSLARQGWKTRWDADRLVVRNKLKRVFSRSLSGALTFAILLVLTAGVLEYRSLVISRMLNNNRFAYAEANVTAHIEGKNATLAKILDEEAYVTYRGRPGDTLGSLARKFNAPTASLMSANPGYQSQIDLFNQVVKVPVTSIRNTRDVNSLVSVRPAVVTYVEPSENLDYLDHVESRNIIKISGRGAVITIPELYETLKKQYPDRNLLEKLDNNEWILHASLEVSQDVVLVITGKDVSWLKLESNPEKFVWLASFDGGMYIADTKITSWDTMNNTYDTELLDDGRSFILAKDSGRMDIINSEIAYLGYSRFKNYPRGYPFGGIYGMSWRIPTGTSAESLITGNLINSTIHNNQFGFYSFGAVGMVIQGNTVRNNIQYGIDPHDDSNYLQIVENEVYSNGNHGIIASKRCIYNVIARNNSYNNKKHGIMLDQASNFNLIEDNVLTSNLDGIAIFDSHGSIIRNNKSINNQNSGIRLNSFSSRNYIEDNSFDSNTYGLYVYDYARDNMATANYIINNSDGLYLKRTENNIMSGNYFDKNSRELRIGEGAFKNAIRL